MSYTAFELKPISGALGAEVFGLDLSQALGSNELGEIRAAFSEYVVLLFRDQDLSLSSHRAFAENFGALIPHPYVQGLEADPDIFEIVREPGENYSWDNFYHSDLMFLQNPPKASALYASEVPPYGADTEFCNMYLAYEALSERMQELACSLVGINESGDPSHWSATYEGMHELRNEATSAAHPVVRVNPDTGRKSLYVSPAFTTRFEGMTVRESAPLIKFFYEHATQSQFGCRLHWQPGSLALWDNRVSLHHAVADYFGEVSKHRRVMRRATIAGEAPIAA
jgi:taurine dioxygenase